MKADFGWKESSLENVHVHIWGYRKYRMKNKLV